MTVASIRSAEYGTDGSMMELMDRAYIVWNCLWELSFLTYRTLILSAGYLHSVIKLRYHINYLI